MKTYVVAESNGATAVVDAFTRWDDALAYAELRAENYRSCVDLRWEVDHAMEHYSFSSSLGPCSERADVARRVDIVVWAVTVYEGAHPQVARTRTRST